MQKKIFGEKWKSGDVETWRRGKRENRRSGELDPKVRLYRLRGCLAAYREARHLAPV